MIWDILGIAPTKDIRTIKLAYAKLAKQFHPEEHPEEFKKIHDAYKAACAFAKSSVKTAPEVSSLPEKEGQTKSEFDFSQLSCFKYAAVPVYTAENILMIMKDWLADPVFKNNHHLWRSFLSNPDVEEIILDVKFRKKAQAVFKKATFSPEAASAIASGFSKGSKAVHYDKDDKIPDSSSSYNIAVPLNDNRALQQWKVLISDGTGKPVKSKPLIPDYARSDIGFNFKVRDLIICILFIALLIIGAAIDTNRDKEYYPYDESETKVTEIFKIGDREFYIDENGKLQEYNGQG